MVSTDPGIALHDITPQIRTLVADSGMARGFLTVTSNAARNERKADLLVFPELALTDYPLEDLLLRP